MNYQQTIDYLFNAAPLFQHIGKDAYKEGLSNTIALDNHFGNPHRKFLTIHVAGTNGKGSCSHTLAAILQSAGYKVGLYTSPHLVDFRERIRVNGKMIGKQKVIDFVKNERSFFEPLQPSFFELATAMAFKHFADEEVDIAVVEVGLGGRLDCTNIIHPLVSVITNISYDHTQMLGDTLEKIAHEKAGIIKQGVPVVVGETVKETRPVFISQAEAKNSPITLAEESREVLDTKPNDKGGIDYITAHFGVVHGELEGIYQIKNTNTILCTLRQLLSLRNPDGQPMLTIPEKAIKDGFSHVTRLTGLMGRWQVIDKKPLTVCDAGHNIGGFEYISRQLHNVECRKMRIVFGMVSDKDISAVLNVLPRHATYYFCSASVKRALDSEVMRERASAFGLQGQAYGKVSDAYQAAREASADDDFIYVGGSCFVVADLLSFLGSQKAKK
jgi:dihydrofolate synthase/folylpolyglutamate synthase